MEAELSIKQMYLFLRRNWISIVVIPVSAVLISLYVATLLTPQFKSRATIEIKASYFKNPLVSDLISEEHDPAELRSQRSSLIQKALDDEFLEEIGQEFRLFSNSGIAKLDAQERARLRNSIEFYSMGPNLFEIAVTATPREQALAIAQKAVARITEVFHETRIAHLKTTRDAMEVHAHDLSKALHFQQEDKTNEKLDEELSRVQDSLSLLLTHFTAKHPSVQKLQTKATILEEQIADSPKSSLVPPEIPLSHVMASRAAKEPVREVHSSLVKKLSDISLVLSMEQLKPAHLTLITAPALPVTAVFPKKKNFALFGLVAGTLLAVLIISVRELNLMVREDPEQVADDVGIPLLGHLPVYRNSSGLMLLEGRKLGEGPRLLTWKSST